MPKIENKTYNSEQEYIEDFSKKISVLNTKEILQYGSIPQQKNIVFTNDKLIHVPEHTNAEICKDIDQLIKELQTVIQACDDRDWNEKCNSLLKNTSYALTNMTRRLEQHISSLTYHLEKLDTYYNENKMIIHEFDMYISAGELCLKRTIEEEIPAQKNKMEQYGLQEDKLLLQDYEDGYSLLKKKIDTLRVSQQIPFQSAIHIRTVQNTEKMMIESLRTIINNAFPLWKSSVTFSQGIPGNIAYPVPKKIYEATTVLCNTLQSVLHIYQEIQ